MASSFTFLGIYSGATSVSEDSILRQPIRRIALGEVRFLDAIGSAEMEQQIVGTISAVSMKSTPILLRY
jgi:hypothetical protein